MKDLMLTCIRTFFLEDAGNQVMLFERAPSSDPTVRFPLFPSRTLFLPLRSSLHPLHSPAAVCLPRGPCPAVLPLPRVVHAPPRARETIINVSWPSEGITPYVNPVDRYGDGIMGTSLGSDCAMQFARAASDQPQGDADVDAPSSPRDLLPVQCTLYLPMGSVVIMTGELRYGWTHGVEKRFDD